MGEKGLTFSEIFIYFPLSTLSKATTLCAGQIGHSREVVAHGKNNGNNLKQLT